MLRKSTMTALTALAVLGLAVTNASAKPGGPSIGIKGPAMNPGIVKPAGGISRAEQDRFSAQSHQRAAKAWKECWFKAEVAPLSAEQIGGKEGVAQDEGIRGDSTAEGLGKLRPGDVRELEPEDVRALFRATGL